MQLQSAQFYAGVETIYVLILFDACTLHLCTVQALAKYVLSSFGKSISSALYVSGCFPAAMSVDIRRFEE